MKNIEYKIELQINRSGDVLDIYIENIKTGEYTIIDTCIVIQDDIQIEQLKKSYEYLGFKVAVKEYTPED